MTCPNGSTVNVGLSDIDAATDANGNLILSNSHWAFGSNTTPLNLLKAGTVTHATITQSSFILTGQEQSDTMCGTAPGATVTLSGPCFAPPGQVATVQFSSVLPMGRKQPSHLT